MTDDSTDAGDASDASDRAATANVVAALRVRRNAAAGFAVGAALAALLLWRVVAAPSVDYPLYYFLALGFVLAVGVGLLLTIALTLGSAWRLSRQR